MAVLTIPARKGDTHHISVLAGETNGLASQIASLAIAANCIITGSQPADTFTRENVALDLLSAIEILAGKIEHDADAIGRAASESPA